MKLYYFLIETKLDHEINKRQCSFILDFPTINYAVFSSREFGTYEKAVEDCVDRLSEKLDVIAKTYEDYQISWVKNEFDAKSQAVGFLENELVTLYITDVKEGIPKVWPIRARIMYREVEDYVFEAPTLLM